MLVYMQLHEQDELTWDDGQFCPEPAIDIVAPMVGKVSIVSRISGQPATLLFPVI